MSIAMLWGTPAMSGDDRPSKAAVAELLRLSGSDNITKDLIPLISTQFVAGLRRVNADVSGQTEGTIRDTVTEYLNAPPQQAQLLDQLAPIYEKELSAAEVRQLIAFYKTPVGRKWTAVLPMINGEVAQAGQAWATRVMPGLKDAVFAGLRAHGIGIQ